MSNIQYRRLVTRRTFSKATLAGIGGVLGAGVWSKSSATVYNTTGAAVTACLDEIVKQCKATFPDLNPDPQNLNGQRAAARIICENALTTAFTTGRAHGGPWAYTTRSRLSAASSAVYETYSDCNSEMARWADHFHMQATQKADLQNNCCHSVPA